MVINRAGALAGSLAIVGGAFVMWPAGDPVRAQQPSVSGPSTVHSIKVTLAPSTPGGADCQLRDPLPSLLEREPHRFSERRRPEGGARIRHSEKRVVTEDPARHARDLEA